MKNIFNSQYEEEGDIQTIEKDEVKEDLGTPKVVVLHNDDYNTFQHVCDCLMKYCKMDEKTAWECTLAVHYKGKCRVAEGSEDYLKEVKFNLQLEGLSVTLENE